MTKTYIKIKLKFKLKFICSQYYIAVKCSAAYFIKANKLGANHNIKTIKC